MHEIGEECTNSMRDARNRGDHVQNRGGFYDTQVTTAKCQQKTHQTLIQWVHSIIKTYCPATDTIHRAGTSSSNTNSGGKIKVHGFDELAFTTMLGSSN